MKTIARPFVFIAAIVVHMSLMLVGFSTARAEHDPVPQGGAVSGILLDSITSQPVVYANVALFSTVDSSIVAGAVTDSTGAFLLTEIEKGRYFLRITFIGYGDLLLPAFDLARGQQLALGTIKLSPSDFNLKGIDIVAEKPLVEYHLDKQVINAEAVQNAATGTAIDILRNSPSVVIDNDDNISLRGNQGFMLLINGVPSVQQPRDALRQIPAAMVQKIEIITNPSARYDAEGVSGIINVILKQQKEKGFGALVNTRVGLNNKYGADISANYNLKKWRFNGSLAWGDDSHQSTSQSVRRTWSGDTTTVLLWDTDRKNGNDMYNARFSAEFTPDAKNTLFVSAEGGFNNWQMEMCTDYTQQITGIENQYFVADYTAEYPGLSTGLTAKFTHQLDTSGAQYSFSASRVSWHGDIKQTNDTWLSNNAFGLVTQMQGSRFREDALMKDHQFNADLTINIFKKVKMESGYQFTYRPFEGQFDAEMLNGGSYITDTVNTTDEWFLQRKHAGYVMFSGKVKTIEIQGGLRTEHFHSEFLLGNDEYNDVVFDDLYFFPSLHISKAFSPRSRWQASYSRRVNYPQDWMIGPTPMYNDGFMFQQGNADLRPEMVDSYELSHIHLIGNGTMLNVTGFYRQINGQLVRTMTMSDEGLLEVNWDNLATSRSYGMEVGSNIQISRIFSANVAAGAYGVNNEGVVTGDSVNSSDFSWNGRVMFNAKVTPATRIQITGFYNAASEEEQGYRPAQGLVGISLRQDFLKGRLSATLNMNDVFNTFRYQFVIKNDDYETEIDFTPEYPRITFGLTWKINNYKPLDNNGQQNLTPVGGGM